MHHSYQQAANAPAVWLLWPASSSAAPVPALQALPIQQSPGTTGENMRACVPVIMHVVAVVGLGSTHTQSLSSVVFPERAGPGWFTGSASAGNAGSSHTPQVLTGTPAALTCHDPPQPGFPSSPSSNPSKLDGSKRSEGSNDGRRSSRVISCRGAVSEAQPSSGQSQQAVNGVYSKDVQLHAHQSRQRQAHAFKQGPDRSSSSSSSRDPFADSNAAMSALKSSSSWCNLAIAVAQHADKPWFNHVHASAAITHMAQLTLKRPAPQVNHLATGVEQQQQRAQQQQKQQGQLDLRPAQGPSQLVLQLLALVAEWLPKLRVSPFNVNPHSLSNCLLWQAP
eukprot:85501-Pelagomonas_calceolata.AAC.4